MRALWLNLCSDDESKANTDAGANTTDVQIRLQDLCRRGIKKKIVLLTLNDLYYST